MSEIFGEVVLNTGQIKDGVKSVSKALNSEYADKEVVVISVVPGGMLFTADLVRELKFDITMDYISCIHTPGDRDNSSPIIYHQNVEVKNKHVILVDDAIESGGTMSRLVKLFQDEYSVLSVAIATLFVKPSRVSIDVTAYYAFEMKTDDMLVGYGLPWNGKYRNIPSVFKLNV
ncbi:MAG: hypoxanthine phosphoribosyltransferase [Alteromonadaceae bacterium]|nr:MAG: hypoxanthine phosphoribosyltransferase [Alteromonadaceae bacterium]